MRRCLRELFAPQMRQVRSRRPIVPLPQWLWISNCLLSARGHPQNAARDIRSSPRSKTVLPRVEKAEWSRLKSVWQDRWNPIRCKVQIKRSKVLFSFISFLYSCGTERRRSAGFPDKLRLVCGDAKNASPPLDAIILIPTPPPMRYS